MNNESQIQKTQKIQIFGHRILIELDKDEEVKAGSIVLPSTASKKKLEQYESGKVLQVGITAFSFLDGMCERPNILNKRVIIKKHAGVSATEKGGYGIEETSAYRIVNDEDVMAIIMEDN